MTIELSDPDECRGGDPPENGVQQQCKPKHFVGRFFDSKNEEANMLMRIAQNYFL